MKLGSQSAFSLGILLALLACRSPSSAPSSVQSETLSSDGSVTGSKIKTPAKTEPTKSNQVEVESRTETSVTICEAPKGKQKPPDPKNLPAGTIVKGSKSCKGNNCPLLFFEFNDEKGNVAKYRFEDANEVSVKDNRRMIEVSASSKKSSQQTVWQSVSLTYETEKGVFDLSVSLQNPPPLAEDENHKRHFNYKLSDKDCSVKYTSTKTDLDIKSIAFECTDDRKTKGEVLFPKNLLLP